MPVNPVAPVPPGRSSGAGQGGRPRRRTVLRAGFAGAASATVLGLTGCRLRVGSPPTDRPTPPPAQLSTDDQSLVRALQQAVALSATYARAALLRPDLATPLQQYAADHAEHVRILQALTAGSSATASATASGPPTSGAGPALTALTATSLLAQSERAAAAQAQGDLVTIGAQPARLLASVAACRSAHVALLARLPQLPPAPTKKSS